MTQGIGLGKYSSMAGIVGATALDNYEMPTSTHDAVPGLLAEKH